MGSLGGKPMSKKLFCFALCAMLFALSIPAHAQQPKKGYRIGYLRYLSRPFTSRTLKTFRQKLHELGYVEGQNVVIEWRSAKGKDERLPDLAAELVRLKLDVIVVSQSDEMFFFWQRATLNIPIFI